MSHASSSTSSTSSLRAIPASTAALVVHIRLSTTTTTKKTLHDVFFELRRRGFLIEGCASDDEIQLSQSALSDDNKKAVPVNYWILISFSPKLLLHLAARKQMTIRNFDRLRSLQKLQLVEAGIDLLLKHKEDLFVVDAWSAHDPLLVNSMHQIEIKYTTDGKKKSVFNSFSINKSKKKSIEVQLDAVYQYFGPQIAIYFGFLNYYTTSLAIPSVVGVLIFLHQYWVGTIDTEYIPFFVIMMSIWSNWFLRSWKSKCSEYCHSWDAFGIEDAKIDREMAKATAKGNNAKIGFQTSRLMFSFLTTMVLIYFMLRIMLYFVDASVHAEEYYGPSYMKYFPQAMTSLLPAVSPLVFEPIAGFLNRLEGHATRSEEESYMIMKKFALQFVNRYSALLYVAFYKKDLEMLRSLLISLLVTGAIVNNGIELGVPYANDLFQRILRRYQKRNVKDDPEPGQGNPAVLKRKRSRRSSYIASSNSPEAPSFIGVTMSEKMIDKERYYSPYDVNDDYLEMVLQFGYVIMFAVVFPITPLLAWINNYFEFDVDLHKLSTLRRPKLALRSSIGGWQICLEVLSFIAIFTNCFMLTMVSTKFSVLIPSGFHVHLESPYGKLLAMIALEHVLLGFNILLNRFVDDVPRFIREDLARKRTKLADAEKALHAKKVGEEGVFLDATEGLQGGEAEAKDNDKHIKNDGILAMYSATNSPYLFGISSPVQMTSLFITPWILNWFNVSPLLYIPASFFYFAYLQTEKERIERQLAIGIVNDQSTLGYLLRDSMPSFIRDHDVQRVEWLNMILQRVWPYFSMALEKMLIPIIQPILTAYTPFFLSCLEIKKCSIGTLAPKLTGIRVFSTDENKITLDIELKWVADLHVSLKVGTQPMPTLVELTELSISGTVRVELLDLMNELPLFKAVSVTCMKKPEVKFSLKIANMVDIMSIGVHPSFSVTAIVQNIINSILNNLMIYPKKMVFHLVTKNVKDYTSVTPIGFLDVFVDRAQDLKAANMFGDSDPYVDITSSMDQKFRTKTIEKTLDPIFEETFRVLVYDLSSQVVDFKVYDWNEFAPSVFLGECAIALSDLVGLAAGDDINVTTTTIAQTGFDYLEKTMPLKNIEKGGLHVCFSYLPIKKDKTDKDASKITFKNIDNDMIYDLPFRELEDNNAILKDVKPADEIINRERRKRNLIKKHKESTASSLVDSGSELSGYESAKTFGSEKSDRDPVEEGVATSERRKMFDARKQWNNLANVTHFVMATASATAGRIKTKGGKEEEDSKVTSNVRPPLTRGGSSLIVPKALNGVLTITAIKAFNLHPTTVNNNGEENGTAKVSVWDFRPFVSISIGKQVQETKYIKNDHNPEFSETLKFALGSAATASTIKESNERGDIYSMVYFRVYDRCSKYSISSIVSMSSSACKMLGFVNVPLAEIMQKIRKTSSNNTSDWQAVDFAYKLDGDYSESTFSCKISWVPSGGN